MTATSVIPSRAGEAVSSHSLLSHFYICNYSAERYLDLPPQLSCSVLQPNSRDLRDDICTHGGAARLPWSRRGEGRDGFGVCSCKQEGFVGPGQQQQGPPGSALRLCGEPAGTDRSQLESRVSGSCRIMGANLPVGFINSHLHFSISVPVHQG